MKCNQIHSFYPDEKAGEDDEEDEILRAQRKWMLGLENKGVLINPRVVMGTIRWLKFLSRSVLYVLKIQVFMRLDIVVICGYVKIVMKIKVLKIY